MGHHYPGDGVDALGVSSTLLLVLRQLPFLHALFQLLLPHPLLLPVGVAVQQEAECCRQLVPRQPHDAAHQPHQHIAIEPLVCRTHCQTVHVTRTACKVAQNTPQKQSQWLKPVHSQPLSSAGATRWTVAGLCSRSWWKKVLRAHVSAPAFSFSAAWEGRVGLSTPPSALPAWGTPETAAPVSSPQWSGRRSGMQTPALGTRPHQLPPVQRPMPAGDRAPALPGGAICRERVGLRGVAWLPHP